MRFVRFKKTMPCSCLRNIRVHVHEIAHSLYILMLCIDVVVTVGYIEAAEKDGMDIFF